MKPLQSHPKLQEIESRLNKQSYLSRNNLPGSPDAKMFLQLQSIKKYPDRKLYPNFYHWYVLMKQFSISSIQKWITNSDCNDIDQSLYDFNSNKLSQKLPTEIHFFKKSSPGSQTVSDEAPKFVKSEETVNGHSNELVYIMDVKIKEQMQGNMKQLVTSFFSQQAIEAPDVQEFTEQRRVRILVRIDPQKFESVKNKISALEGIQTFESKKKDKRFKTVNSTSNPSGQA